MKGKKRESVDGLLNRYKPSALDSENPTLITIESQLPEALEKYDEILKQGVFYVNVNNKVTAVLTNEELNMFLKIAEVHRQRLFHHQRLGSYVSLLVQNAYEKGTSAFSLDFRHTNYLYGVGEYILGKPERPVIFNVEGNVGWNFGCSSEHVEFTLTRDVQPNCGYQAKHCLFKTPRKETLKKFLTYLPEQDSYRRSTNKIIFIKPNGGEEVVAERG